MLLGRESAALIDTGLGVAQIRSVVQDLTDLPVKVLTAHVHWDHIGGHGSFVEIAVHEKEVDWLNGHFPLSREAVLHMSILSSALPETSTASGCGIRRR